MSPVWICEVCTKSFSRKADLGRHSHLHTGYKYECRVQIYPGYKPHKCDECGKAFSQSSALKTHMNVHTGARPFACGMDGCISIFGDPSSRARHCKEAHRMLGAYRCPFPYCGSSIKRRSAFTLHLSKKHKVDPKSIDIDALAPSLRPLHSIHRRVPADAYAWFTSDTNVLYDYDTKLLNSHTNSSCYPSQSLYLPEVSMSDLYTIDSHWTFPEFNHPSSATSYANDIFTFSNSSSPASLPSSSSSTPSPPASQSPFMSFSGLTYVDHDQKPPF